MRKLLPYFRGSRVKCILAPLFKMLEATLELIVPLIVAEMIDRGISLNDKPYVIKLSIQMIILCLVGLVFSITAQYFAASTAVSTVKRIRHAAFSKIQEMDFTQYDRCGSSNLITRLTGDMDSVQNGINLTLRLLLRSPFVVLGACIMAFRVDRGSAVTFAVVIPLLGIIVFAIMSVTIPMWKKVRYSLDRVLVSARESLTGVRVIRAFNIEKEQEKEFSFLNESLTSMQELAGGISSLMNPVTTTVVNVGIAVLLYVGAIRVNAGLITTGAVVALYNYMSQILVELIKLANLIISVTKSIACASRIADVLESEPETASFADSSSESYIEFRNVSFAYSGSPENSIEKVSFTAKKGEKIGIIGSTGSGKTTLVSLLAGFYNPTEGDIIVDGVNTKDKDHRKARISVAEQKPFLFEGTVRSNLLMGSPDADGDALSDALEKAQAYSFVSEKDGVLDAEVRHNGNNFSGGQKQRLSLARALASDPDILILDDSSSALDYSTESKIRKAISEDSNLTVFTVSQRISSIQDSDMIIVLEDGKAEIGTHGYLLENSETYREIYSAQTDGEEAV